MKLAVIHFMETLCSVFGSNKAILFSIKRIIKIKNVSYLGLIIDCSFAHIQVEIYNQILSCSEKKRCGIVFLPTIFIIHWRLDSLVGIWYIYNIYNVYRYAHSRSITIRKTGGTEQEISKNVCIPR